MTLTRAARLLRIGLFALAFESGLIAVHALFFPEYFYSGFLLGRGWVEMLPPYNEHLTRDLGALYLGFFLVLGFAGVKLTKDVVTIAIVGFTAATFPHLVFHAMHTEDAPLLLDKILQTGLLGLTVAIGVALYGLSRWYYARIDDLAGRPAPVRRPAHLAR